jgi:hypothetical protein
MDAYYEEVKYGKMEIWMHIMKKWNTESTKFSNVLFKLFSIAVALATRGKL